MNIRIGTIEKILLEHGELTGLEIVEHSEGRLKRGTVYVVLDVMEKERLITSEVKRGPSGPNRRHYKLVDHETTETT